MEAKVLFSTLFALVVLGSRETGAATFFSIHGPRGAAIAASSPLLQSRLKIRQTAAAQQPQTYSFPQQQQQQQQEAQASPPGNFLFYPQNPNPGVSAQLTGQNQQAFPQVQPYAQYLQQQQQLQQQQLQELYQQQQQQQQQYQQVQQQPQFQQLQQQPGSAASQPGFPFPGGIRYIFTSAGRTPARLSQQQNQPQVVEEQASDPAQPAPGLGQLGVAFSPASSVASIKFSNPYASYSY